MNLPPDQSDNAQRILRITAFARRWFISDHQERSAILKIIDIGAGLGVFLSRFLEENRKEGIAWHATALEPDTHAARHLRSLKQFEVREVEFAGQTEFSGYDLCTLNKVVEHIEHPVSFLNHVSKLLSKERGLAYIEVPDVMTINYRNPQDNILGALHFHLYNFKSLSYLLKAANFVPIHMERILEPSGKITMTVFATIPSVFENLVIAGEPWQKS
jgi:2-polyprenyl-3-methyl-5-hydroxy-6-metoxy-1,4-benzoquinol methylase